MQYHTPTKSVSGVFCTQNSIAIPQNALNVRSLWPLSPPLKQASTAYPPLHPSLFIRLPCSLLSQPACPLTYLLRPNAYSTRAPPPPPVSATASAACCRLLHRCLFWLPASTFLHLPPLLCLLTCPLARPNPLLPARLLCLPTYLLCQPTCLSSSSIGSYSCAAPSSLGSRGLPTSYDQCLFTQGRDLFLPIWPPPPTPP